MADHRARSHGGAPAASSAGTSAAQIAGWTVFAFVALGLLVAFVFSLEDEVYGPPPGSEEADREEGSESSEPEEADPLMGFFMCEDFVSDRLSAVGISRPVFPDPTEDDGEVRTSVQGSRVTVRSTYEVDDGAKSDFTCVVRDVGDDEWRLVDLDLGLLGG